MDLRQLEFAVVVADELNFTRAAARCHIGQSGLSHQIAELEREIGARLFDRTNRGVRLTSAGQEFVAGARRVLCIMQETNAAIASLDGHVRGELLIGVIPLTAGQIDVIDVLREYQKSHPAVQAIVSDVGSLTAAAQLVSGELEVAVLGLQGWQLPSGVAHHLLCLEPLVAVVGRQHPLRGAGVTGLDALADDRFLDCAPDTGLRAQVEAAYDRAGVRRSSVCVLRSARDLTSLALEGIGVTLVPLPAAEAIVPAEHSDCVLRLDDPLAQQPLVLAHRDPLPVSPAAQAFVRLALARLAPHNTAEGVLRPGTPRPLQQRQTEEPWSVGAGGRG